MSIEGVTGARIIQRLRAVQSSDQAKNSGEVARTETDRLNISGDARFAQTLARVQEKLNETPEVREDRVAEACQNLANGVYESDQAIEGAADNLASIFAGE